MRGVHAAVLLLACLTAVGCEHWHSGRVVPPPGCDPHYSQYHLDTFQWTTVSRVLVLPFANEAGGIVEDEINRSFRAELQQLGKFEVVAACPDDLVKFSVDIHKGGRFREDAMLALAKVFSADVIIHGTVTEYSPYPRPRIGIVIQAVAPHEAKVIASVDGLWDANHLPIAKRAQNYYMQRKHKLGPYEEANWIWPDDGHADELALLSPRLYQRWVCSELVAILVQDPAIVGTVFAPHGTKAVTPVKRPYEIPGEPVAPAAGQQPKAEAKAEPKMPRAKP
jgi:hypothetical protein